MRTTFTLISVKVRSVERNTGLDEKENKPPEKEKGFPETKKNQVENKVRRIKRIKITVIRTETVFLRKQNGGYAKELLLLQSAGLTENDKDSILEIKTINKQLGNTDK